MKISKSFLRFTFLILLNFCWILLSAQPCGTQIKSPDAQVWPAPIAEGPFHLSICFTDIQSGFGSSIPQFAGSSNTLSDAFNYLNQIYNPHNIFFELVSPACTSNVSVRTIVPGDGTDPLGFINDDFNATPGQITIAIGKNGGGAHFNSGNSTASEPLPTNKCLVNVDNTWTQDYFNYVMAHEVGHCLGLFHNFEECQDLDQPDIVITCGETGDLICDNPPQSNNLQDLVDAGCNPMPGSNIQPWYSLDNLMSYSYPTCATELTCQQAAKARYLIATYPDLKACLTSATVPNSDPSIIGFDEKHPVITSNTVWTSPKYVYGIRVKSGNTLTINGTEIYFYPLEASFNTSTEEWTYDNTGADGCAVPSINPACGSIVVEPGARLVINNSIITTPPCYPNMRWEGIAVEGDPNLPQTDSNQGVVEISNSTIENALTGIHTYQWIFPKNAHGGIVRANWATFKNNDIGVLIKNHQNMNGSVEQPNKSFFKNCTFLVDDGYFGDLSVTEPIGLKLEDVKRIVLRECTFDYAVTDPAHKNKGTGLYSNRGSFEVGTNSQFNGWKRGIDVAEYCFNLLDIKIEHNTFTDNTFGCFLNATTNSVVTNNVFNVPKSMDAQNIPVGLYLCGSSGFVVEGNDFNEPWTGFSYGIGSAVNNSGPHPHLINDNTYDGFRTSGAAAYGNNKNIPSQSNNFDPVGLQFACNNFGENQVNQTDVHVKFNGGTPAANEGISEWQGTSTEGANNLFTNDPYVTHINNEGYSFDYFYSNGNSRFQPTNGQGAFTIQPTGQPASYEQDCGITGFDDLYNDGTYALQGALQNHRSTINLYKTNLVQLIDEGSTPQLEAEILLAGQSEYQQLYLDLMDIAPYVSEENLLNMLGLDNFPELAARNILIANPHSARSPEVMDAVYEHQPPYSQQTIDDIEAEEQTITTKDVAEAKLAALHIEKQRTVTALIKHFGSDTLNPDYDALISMLRGQDELYYWYRLVETDIALGRYADALLDLDSISTELTLDDYENTEYNDLHTYYTLVANAGLSEEALDDLGSTDIQTLSTLEQSGYGRSPFLARALLSLNGISSSYEPPRYIPAETSGKRAAEKIARPEKTRELFKVYPNPAEDYLIVQWDWFRAGLSKPITIRLTDSQGRLLMAKEIEDFQKNTEMLYLEGLASGLYLLEVLHGEKQEYVQRVVKK